jgi:hypothetical protein
MICDRDFLSLDKEDAFDLYLPTSESDGFPTPCNSSRARASVLYAPLEHTAAARLAELRELREATRKSAVWNRT